MESMRLLVELLLTILYSRSHSFIIPANSLDLRLARPLVQIRVDLTPHELSRIWLAATDRCAPVDRPISNLNLILEASWTTSLHHHRRVDNINSFPRRVRIPRRIVEDKQAD